VKKTNPRASNPFSSIMRTDGPPSGVAVASAIASGRKSPDFFAEENHRSKRAIGSDPADDSESPPTVPFPAVSKERRMVRIDICATLAAPGGPVKRRTRNQMNASDFENERKDFRLEVPERFNFSRDVIDRWAEDPQRRALWWIDDRGNELQWTFAELARESRKVAGGLARLGVSRGDVVLVR
jgi:hypothetical protein